MSDIYYSTIKGIFEASELEALSDRESRWTGDIYSS